MERLNPDGLELPPPPPIIPPNVVPIVAEEKSLELSKKASTPKRVPMARTGNGTKGQKIPLLTNHFKVAVNKSDDFFFHYSVITSNRCLLLYTLKICLCLYIFVGVKYLNGGTDCDVV